jgi:hypothetical protein
VELVPARLQAGAWHDLDMASMPREVQAVQLTEEKKGLGQGLCCYYHSRLSCPDSAAVTTNCAHGDAIIQSVHRQSYAQTPQRPRHNEASVGRVRHCSRPSWAFPAILLTARPITSVRPAPDSPKTVIILRRRCACPANGCLRTAHLSFLCAVYTLIGFVGPMRARVTRVRPAWHSPLLVSWPQRS